MFITETIRAKTTLIIFALLFFTIACNPIYFQHGTNSIPKKDVAILESPTPDNNPFFIISHIDGVSRGFGIFKEYYLMPGDRLVRISPPKTKIDANSYEQGIRSIDLSFKAEAGKRYKIIVKMDLSAHKWTGFVVDMSTNQPVSKMGADHFAW